ncbi:MAG: hypothetical protein JNL97_01390, partial [Verrucomicrobiales bacterium]|nr:hypothetical protein [Verrucomicrobiales bacterium]
MTRASLIVWIRLGLWPWLVPSPVSAAVPDRYAGAQAATWGMDRGLPHTAVESLLQARDGFLWVGTREGLARFDGARFVVFDGTTEGFTSDACVDLAEDGSRGIWVATKKGAYRYASGRFTRFTTVDGLPADSVRQLHPLPDVGMGLATSGGLAIREGDRFRSIPFTVTNVEPDFHRVVTRNAESLLRAR